MLKRREIEADSSDSSSSDEERVSRKRRRKNSSLKKGANKTSSAAAASKVHPNDLPRDTKYTNKQRVLVLSSRGLGARERHLMNDIIELLPHSKKDSKLDTKSQLSLVNELCEMKNCNEAIFFEARKRGRDVYMWVAKTPSGPTAKFRVQNVHTTKELKLTGNCLKASRPVLSFGKEFDSAPHLKLLKAMFSQVFGSPRGHPKTMPFVDHVLSFHVLDNRIWFRNHQIVYDAVANKNIKKADPVLVEIGPRLVLNPITILAGGFQGATLWQNPSYVSPNTLRSEAKKELSSRYVVRKQAKSEREQSIADSVLPKSELEDVFAQEPDSDDDEEEDDELAAEIASLAASRAAAGGNDDGSESGDEQMSD